MFKLPEIPEVDWSSPDIQRVVEVFGWKYEQKLEENAEQGKKIAEQCKKIAELSKENADLNERIRQLEAALAQTQQNGGDGKSTGEKDMRSYNTRKFKDYPKAKSTPQIKEYVDYGGSYRHVPDSERTVDAVADILFCPIHGTPLSDSYSAYDRVIEDAEIGGTWVITKMEIRRRYCKTCGMQHTAMPYNVLPKEHFGINIMSQVAVLRNLVISFGTIQKLFVIIYDRFIHVSTLEGMYNTVADKCRPIYEDLLANLKNSTTISGDHTGWFYNGRHYHTGAIISDDSVVYTIMPTKKGMVAESILQDFDGIMLSDSDASWNSMGQMWQKCILHYLRDIGRTLEKNQSKEFAAFAHELRLIMKRIIKLFEKLEDNNSIPESYIQNLERRTARLISGAYQDADCKRYVKRLRREKDHLFTCLRYDVAYHNNKTENAMRLFARMRKTLYGNRSMRGLKSLETLTTIYATCEMRRINMHHFLLDYLNGKINAIPNTIKSKKTIKPRPNVVAA